MDQREPWNEASIGLSPMRAEIDVGLGKRVSRFALAALFVGYVAFIVVNGLSISGKLGPTNAEVSDLYPTPITPDGTQPSTGAHLIPISIMYMVF